MVKVVKQAAVFLILLSIVVGSASVSAFTQDGLNSILNGTPYYNPNDTSSASVSCAVSSAQLSSQELSEINQNMPVYQQAAQQTNVPWQLLAAIHYREHDLSLVEPDNTGVYQITDPNAHTPGAYPATGTTLNQAQFLAQSIDAGKFLQAKVASNLSNHQAPLQQTGNDPEEIKDTLFSYNGRADYYASVAAQLGFNQATQPYEGSAYVMNNFDTVHQNMDVITGYDQSNNPLTTLDTRLGAFTIFSILVNGSGGCSNPNLASGNTQQLAEQIINNPSITFDYGASGYVAQPFKDLAAGNLAGNNSGCPPTAVNIHILQEILLLAQTHKVNISSLTTDHPCGDVHTEGRAVDINILDGTHLGSGNGPNMPSTYDTALANTLMTDALPALPSGSAFGDCDGHSIPHTGKDITFFPDNCNHVHTTVPAGQ